MKEVHYDGSNCAADCACVNRQLARLCAQLDAERAAHLETRRELSVALGSLRDVAERQRARSALAVLASGMCDDIELRLIAEKVRATPLVTEEKT